MANPDDYTGASLDVIRELTPDRDQSPALRREVKQLTEERDTLVKALLLAETALLEATYEDEPGCWQSGIKEGYDIPEVAVAMVAIRALRAAGRLP